ncbi:helix-turn-helix domain-containing protein [Streptomyces rochei]|uniref:helix-turn-helix domain-containing protein n=1 Tax=Streptomyces rochei TaxID=1928 RepID=UPI003696BBCE
MLRARIVLAAADGLASGAIARELEVRVNTVRKWRGRFAALGPDGLRGAERSGRPKIYGPEVRVAIVATATSRPPHPEVTWSHRAIAQPVADACSVSDSASQVGRILAGLDLKPHKVRGWLTRRDTPNSGSERPGCAPSTLIRRRGQWCSPSTRRPRSPPVHAAIPVVPHAQVNPPGRNSSTGVTAPPPSSPLSTCVPVRSSLR